MSLGVQRGAAIIGKPLDLNVLAVLAAQDVKADLCISADVFFGDNKLEGSRVRVTSQPIGTSSREIVIHIRSGVLIDEPVVALNLRAGCQQKIERRYVVLAELTTDINPPSVQPYLPNAEPRSLASETSSNSADPKSQLLKGGKQEGASISQAVTFKQTPFLESSSESRPATTARRSNESRPSTRNGQRGYQGQFVGAAKPRLKLELMNLSVESDPALKLSTELISTPSENAQQRSLAAALWRALTAQPDDILRSSEKLLALETSIAMLQAETKKQNLAISQLTGEIEKARTERYSNAFIFVLAALLAIVLVALLYAWRRQVPVKVLDNRQLPWWKRNKAQETGWINSFRSADLPPSADVVSITPASVIRAKKYASSTVDVELDANSGGSSFGIFRRPGKLGRTSIPPLQNRDRFEFGMSITHMLRAVKAEELQDVQQQADFFVSLGQHEQAIEVLREHISADVQTSAMIYLDLFNLYHLLQRESDYENLRLDFSQLFNAKMPEFSLYSDASPGLEAYPAALNRIELLWGSVKVLDVIEESIFRKRDAQNESFDLGAYQELLLLYAVAKDVVGQGDEDRYIETKPGNKSGQASEQSNASNTTKFFPTSIQPLPASVTAHMTNQAPVSTVPVMPKPSSRLGLDVDLSDMFDEFEPELIIENNLYQQKETDSKFFADFDLNSTVAVTQAALVGNVPPRDAASSKNSNLLDFESSTSSEGKVDSAGKR